MDSRNATRSCTGQEYSRVVGDRYGMYTHTGDGQKYSTDFVSAPLLQALLGLLTSMGLGREM